MQILYGNLAPEGCVAKITGKEGLVFEGPAKVYDSEEEMLAALSKDPTALKVCGASLAPWRRLKLTQNVHSGWVQRRSPGECKPGQRRKADCGKVWERSAHNAVRGLKCRPSAAVTDCRTA